jgi:hypothetical protein
MTGTPMHQRFDIESSKRGEGILANDPDEKNIPRTDVAGDERGSIDDILGRLIEWISVSD